MRGAGRLALAVVAAVFARGAAARPAAEYSAAAPPAEIVELGETQVVRAGDTLMDIARAHDLGYVELMSANPGVDPWRPKPGTRLVLPTTHIAPQGVIESDPADSKAGLVANMGDMRLYFRDADGTIASFPMGIGREGWSLHPATTRVVRKREHPTWTPPKSIRAEKPWLPASVPPGPDNPLGDYALNLGLGLIRIHGTNLPDGVGRRVSHGCMRLYPEDIARLFPEVSVGTPVAIVDQPTKLAWIDGDLWLEAHPSRQQADAVEERRPMPVEPIPGLREKILAAAGSLAGSVDWAVVAWVEDHRPSVPVRILHSPGGR